MANDPSRISQAKRLMTDFDTYYWQVKKQDLPVAYLLEAMALTLLQIEENTRTSQRSVLPELYA